MRRFAVLGSMVGEWAGLGHAVGPADVGGPPLPLTGGACAMGGVTVAVTQRYRFKGTLRVWCTHHPETAAVPGLAVLAARDVDADDDGSGSPAFRPWATPLAWLSPHPEAAARDALLVAHEEDGVQFQAGLASVRIVRALLAGAPDAHCVLMPGDHPALRTAGDPTVEALLGGLHVGLGGDLSHVVRAVSAWDGPEALRPAVGAVAGAVSVARHGVPGWAHAVALRLPEDDLLAALGLFEAGTARSPVPRDHVALAPARTGPLAEALPPRGARLRAALAALAAPFHLAPRRRILDGGETT